MEPIRRRDFMEILSQEEKVSRKKRISMQLLSLLRLIPTSHSPLRRLCRSQKAAGWVTRMVGGGPAPSQMEPHSSPSANEKQPIRKRTSELPGCDSDAAIRWQPGAGRGRVPQTDPEGAFDSEAEVGVNTPVRTNEQRASCQEKSKAKQFLCLHASQWRIR